MKRTIFILMLLVCALTLCACVFGGEEPEITDPIYSYDIDVCVHDPDPAYAPRYYYDLSFCPYDEGHFVGGVNADMYTLKGYYTEPNGEGIKICDADLIYTFSKPSTVWSSTSPTQFVFTLLIPLRQAASVV